jgi:cell volume regulation protein A
MDAVILTTSGLFFLSFLLVPLSDKIGAPVLLLVLVAGMLVGEDGPGGVHFDDFSLAFTFGSLALAIILFVGGLETRLDALRGSKLPASILATAGVVLTALCVGLAATVILDIPLEYGLLLGAVVGSTDAAATFLLIRQQDVGLPERLENTLILESGINDPMAIFLTVAFTGVVNAGDGVAFDSLAGFLPLLVLQLGIGAGAGYVGGRALTSLFNSLSLPGGLYPAMTVAGALSVFSATAMLGGSGFLAVYVAGVVIRARLERPVENILNFGEALQWLSQIALFLMLGLLVTPSDLLDGLPGALAVAAVLMFVARPLAVACTVSWLSFTARELIYLGWVGLRGAVPIFLAIMPVVAEGPVPVAFFNVVFVIVVASLVIQGWTIAPSARWLGLAGKSRTAGDRR